MKTIAGMILMASMLWPVAAGSAEKNTFQFKKQAELQQIKPKKPVKIRLKRTAKEEYSWELSGDDADEIVLVDRRLRKLLLKEK